MPSPICRCRTLYIGSAVPTVTKDGLQGIQEPLRERYPVTQAAETKGIDSWLSVWSNGLLLEYVGESGSESRFFPITSLHYCAAVRYVNVSGYAVEGGGERFLPLDSPFAQLPSDEPPIFAAILRRTSGVKVLECHAFICAKPAAANALVSSCFRAYADSIHMKVPGSLGSSGEEEGKGAKDSSRSSSPADEPKPDLSNGDDSNSDREILRWSETTAAGKPSWQRRQQAGDIDTASISSSLAGRYRKREKVTPPKNAGRTRSELGVPRSSGGTLVPVQRRQAAATLQYRRSNSDANLAMASATLPRNMRAPLPLPGPPGMPMFVPPGFRPPPPHMMGPPPPGMPMFAGPPPPFMMHGPPPMGMEGPPHPPPHMMMGPPPPEMRGPPPPPHMMPPPADFYGTYRSAGPGMRSMEEPLYMAGSVGPGGPLVSHPPEFSYNPASFPPEQYSDYADTGRRSRGLYDGGAKPAPRGAESIASSVPVEEREDLYWDANVYQSGIYRRQPYLNEKAFGTAMRGGELGRRPDRPPTPPIDYDELGRMSLRDREMYRRPLPHQRPRVPF